VRLAPVSGGLRLAPGSVAARLGRRWSGLFVAGLRRRRARDRQLHRRGLLAPEVVGAKRCRVGHCARPARGLRSGVLRYGCLWLGFLRHGSQMTARRRLRVLGCFGLGSRRRRGASDRHELIERADPIDRQPDDVAAILGAWMSRMGSVHRAGGSSRFRCCFAVPAAR
jgi:hypothetical protein